MRIERIEEMRLTPAIEAEIADLLVAAFGEDFGGRSFHKQRHHLRLIARDGTRMVSHMALCYRAIRLGGDLHDMVGLAEVSTAPDRRGEGIAACLLGRAIEEARESTAPFFALFGVAGLYAGHGFRTVHNPLRWVGMDDARTSRIFAREAEDLMILELRDVPWDEGVEVDLLGPLF